MTSARFGGSTKAPTAKEKRIARGQAAAALVPSTARRGETEGPEEEVAVLPHQAAEPTPLEPAPEAVVKASELADALQYKPAPEGATGLELLAHAQRGIVNANLAVGGVLGRLQRDYSLAVGRYLLDVTESKSYKAAGHKSVEAFAATLDLSRRDVYRLRDAVPVYGDIGDLVAQPIPERIIRELAIAHRRSGSCRPTYEEALRSGRLSAAGVVEARRRLVAGELSEIIESGPEDRPVVPAVEQLAKAFKAGKWADLEVLKQAAKESPDAVRAYADAARQHYEAAMKALES